MACQVVTQDEWLEARKALLQREKDLTRATAKLYDEFRDLPMVKVDKPYIFHTADGTDVSLADLFRGKKQLIVYHFMFSPEDDEGCSGCTFVGEQYVSPLSQTTTSKRSNGAAFPTTATLRAGTRPCAPSHAGPSTRSWPTRRKTGGSFRQ